YSRKGARTGTLLPPELLLSLREWWRVRPTRFDEGVPVGERWLFPGRRQGQHLTYRQLSRVFHESAAAARITKRVSLHTLRHYSEARIMPSIGSVPAEDRCL